MAYLNLYLTTGQTLNKEDVISTGLMFNRKFPTKWTDASMPTFENLLCNLVKYENQEVLYEQRAKPNVMARYNPMGLGHKKLIQALPLSYNKNLIEYTYINVIFKTLKS